MWPLLVGQKPFTNGFGKCSQMLDEYVAALMDGQIDGYTDRWMGRRMVIWTDDGHSIQKVHRSECELSLSLSSCAKRQVPSYIPDFASTSAKHRVYSCSDPTGILRGSSRIMKRDHHSLTCLLSLAFVCAYVLHPIMARSLASTRRDRKQNVVRCLESAGLRTRQSPRWDT